MKIAVAQMQSSSDPYENLLLVNDYVQEATDRGARWIFFPENVFYRGPKKIPGVFDRTDIELMFSDNGVLEANKDFASSLKDFSGGWKIGVSLGSVLESSGEPRPFNSHVLWIPEKRSFHRYQKIHLFRFEGARASYNEELDIKAGESLSTVESSDGFSLGPSICFDLRFPELYRDLVIKHGANVLLVPAAFTLETGRAHWHSLLRSRAIENQSFVVASAQWGSHRDSRGQLCHCYGHSLVYSPWGDLLAEAGETGDALLWVDLQASDLESARNRLPALSSVKKLFGR